MNPLILWIGIAALVVAPLTSIIWLYLSWNRFKETVPFTPEYEKKRSRLIVAAVVAGVLVSIFLVIMGIYGVKVVFAELLA